MAEQKRKQPLHLGVGTTSIIAVFVMLCLTALAVLNLSSARGSLKLTQKNADYMEAYYEAAAQAQIYLADCISGVKNGSAEPGLFSREFPFSDDRILNFDFIIEEDGAVNILQHSVSGAQYDDEFSDFIEDGFRF